MANPRLLPSNEIDAHEWMNKLRFDYYRVNQLRNMRLHEQLWVGVFDVRNDGRPFGRCEAYFERRRGHFTFNAVWTVIWRNHAGKLTIRRPHIFTWGDFKLLTGNRIVFDDRSLEGEKTFRLVCRYLAFFDRHYTRFFGPIDWDKGVFPLRRGEVIDPEGFSHRYGRPTGPEAKGLSAIVEAAMAMGIVGEESCDA
ncbi:MAG: hypothetical protein Q8M09_11790 [Pseudomonadota bacterium]|nr:hypothetical protein [Pseudomonadota bacterium]MDP1904911.1 hypothetical protein [Pseudomonadota bacterium]MDP2352034.1 hypothetical protein [Pseudomonadota bacterium]